MEKIKSQAEKISRSLSWKVLTIAFITLVLLIPGTMIQDLISERSNRNDSTIETINKRWSNEQTINGPVVSIPYETRVRTTDNKENIIRHTLYITPEELTIKGNLNPQVRHLGIFKSILYESQMEFSGFFPVFDFSQLTNSDILWNEAKIHIGLSDLRGVNSIPQFQINQQDLTAASGGKETDLIGQGLIIELNQLKDFDFTDSLHFHGVLHLKGSNSMNFIPIGKNTHIEMSGQWKDPGFTGNFLPEYTITDNEFNAKWDVLHFNRNIPDHWIDKQINTFDNTVFGVQLVDTVNHYQKNMRSAKYSIMFILLTFIALLFVEILTGKRIHPLQYLLAGLALILFYSLLLSLSEQIGFGLSYLISSIAIISMISLYAHSIFKNAKNSGIVASILAILYGYLYIVIQIEDIALLIGSIGLFIILGIIMMVSGKINWYRDINNLD